MTHLDHLRHASRLAEHLASVQPDTPNGRRIRPALEDLAAHLAQIVHDWPTAIARHLDHLPGPRAATSQPGGRSSTLSDPTALAAIHPDPAVADDAQALADLEADAHRLPELLTDPRITGAARTRAGVQHAWDLTATWHTHATTILNLAHPTVGNPRPVPPPSTFCPCGVSCGPGERVHGLCRPCHATFRRARHEARTCGHQLDLGTWKARRFVHHADEP
jgi:hypothetical protein